MDPHTTTAGTIGAQPATADTPPPLPRCFSAEGEELRRRYTGPVLHLANPAREREAARAAALCTDNQEDNRDPGRLGSPSPDREPPPGGEPEPAEATDAARLGAVATATTEAEADGVATPPARLLGGSTPPDRTVDRPARAGADESENPAIPPVTAGTGLRGASVGSSRPTPRGALGAPDPTLVDVDVDVAADIPVDVPPRLLSGRGVLGSAPREP